MLRVSISTCMKFPLEFINGIRFVNFMIYICTGVYHLACCRLQLLSTPLKFYEIRSPAALN